MTLCNFHKILNFEFELQKYCSLVKINIHYLRSELLVIVSSLACQADQSFENSPKKILRQFVTNNGLKVTVTKLTQLHLGLREVADRKEKAENRVEKNGGVLAVLQVNISLNE